MSLVIIQIPLRLHKGKGSILEVIWIMHHLQLTLVRRRVLSTVISNHCIINFWERVTLIRVEEVLSGVMWNHWIMETIQL